MKIIRHTARDMRQALRAVREQLGEDAVILSSRRTDEGVEVTAAVDFDASNLESGGFTSSPEAAPAAAIAPPAAAAARATAAPTRTNSATSRANAAPARANPAPARAGAQLTSTALVLTTARQAKSVRQLRPAPEPDYRPETLEVAEPGSAYALADRARSYEAATARGSTPHDQGLAHDTQWISAAARDAVAAHVPTASAPVAIKPATASRTEVPIFRAGSADPVEQAHEAALAPFGAQDGAPTASYQAPPAHAPASSDVMGNELKTLRRMLETQLAHLAWNDLTRRAPIHTEMLRELTEIGIAHDLAEHLVRQLPADTDLTFARRFTIAGLSQYLRVTGDRWLDDGGRVAFAGATGVGKTTTLAKVAVRWVLRHGPRDIALVAADSNRIGAQDQLQSFGQLLGVSVYTADKFENLPSLLSQLNQRLVLIDTPGSSARDAQLGGRLAVLANSASKLETALVLAASTQAGALEEAVKHFAPANPSCCVLTKVDEAVSLGGVLSVLIRARMPVSYVSEGQRVPEDLRPARALELVSAAIRLAKARGAAADEDLLRRRFGKNAHGIT